MTGLLFRGVEVDGSFADVLAIGGRIERVERGAPSMRPTGDIEIVEGDGGALLPGLHDHHIHLAALAAAAGSVFVGPPHVSSTQHLIDVLTSADRKLTAGEWIRATGYHESVAGPLDRHLLDRIVPGRPVRVQDRSGKRWTLNSEALRRIGPRVGADEGADLESGVFDRADEWLRDAIGAEFPDLTEVSRRLTACGVTGVTDCTPYDDPSGPDHLAAAVVRDEISQEVVVTGGANLTEHRFDPVLRQGPVKLVLDDDRLPDLDEFVDSIRRAHRADRPVAIHIVTAASLAFALAAWDLAGVRPGDRIEHGSIIVPGAVARIVELGLAVVTQPGFVAERGDHYLGDVDRDEIASLYRCGSLFKLGVPIAGSSDAPYTDPDPWKGIAAAVVRRTQSCRVIGRGERLSPAEALGLYLRDPIDLGRLRRVEAGAVADLCLLSRPLSADGLPCRSDVRATFRAGVRI